MKIIGLCQGQKSRAGIGCLDCRGQLGVDSWSFFLAIETQMSGLQII